MRIAALVKQVPKFEAMELGPDGRLQRAGVELELNPYCRRAVAQAVELAAAAGGRVTVCTLGPPSAEDSLREAVAWGLARGVETDAVHVCDPAFAGSDTLATARALSCALALAGPFDLVLTGRNSVDADTGQVGPELAELCDLPFLAGVRELAIEGGVVHARCEHDDGWLEAAVPLPALLSCAERLCEPAKVDPDGRAAVPAEAIRCVGAAELGPGPWGAAGSPTAVGRVRVLATPRARWRDPGAPLAEQVRGAVRLLAARGALDGRAGEGDAPGAGAVPPARATAAGPAVAVAVEPGRARITRELLGAAARLAAGVDGRVAAFHASPPEPDPDVLGAWGADEVVHASGAAVEEDVAAALAAWAAATAPWAILAPGTMWGREVASRAAARLGAGLTGDAVALELDGGRLVAWKPAFGGQLVAAITASSPVQLATVRAGVLPTPRPRAATASVSTITVAPRGRVRVVARTREDDLDLLAEAPVVVGVGQGVDPSEYPLLEPLTELLGAQLGATRKVTDRGWLPRSRQIGITGRTIAPRLYVSIGASGKFNHTVGVRGAGTVLALNAAPEALVFDHADAGIVGDWRDALPLLVDELRAAQADGATPPPAPTARAASTSRGAVPRRRSR